MTTPPDGEQARTPPALDTRTPQAARRYNALLGGKDNFGADRASAASLIEAFPDARTAAAENRRFLRRVVHYLAADHGIRQFLDVGVGMPLSPNVHEIAHSVDPASRVLYVDNDPLVGVHARALLADTTDGRSVFIPGDLRQPDTILGTDEARQIIADGRPVGLLIIAVLHFITDADQPLTAVRHLLDALPTGSYLAVSHGTYDLLPTPIVARLQALAATAEHGTLRPRSRDEVAAFTDGLHLMEPGLVPIVHWQPHRKPKPRATPAQAAGYGFVARKP